MSQDFEKLFSQLDCATPSSSLLPNIKQRLVKERARLIFRKRLAGVFSAVGMVASSLVLIATGISLYSSLGSSGFWNFLSLIFSDFDVVATYWQSLLWSLLEALPLLTLAIFFGAMFSFAESIRILSFDYRFLSWRTSHN